MVSHAESFEPERTHLGKQLSLARNPAGQNVIECTDAIGADNQQRIPQIVNVPNFSTTAWQWQLGFKQSSGRIKSVQVVALLFVHAGNLANQPSQSNRIRGGGMLFQGRKLRGIHAQCACNFRFGRRKSIHLARERVFQVTIWLLCISMISGKHSVFWQPQRISGSRRVVAEWSQSGRRTETKRLTCGPEIVPNCMVQVSIIFFPVHFAARRYGAIPL